MSGLELQQLLVARGSHIPIIFINRAGSQKAQALQAGALAFLRKPSTKKLSFTRSSACCHCPQSDRSRAEPRLLCVHRSLPCR
jgi:FixJ family two-component response regulator